MQQWLGTVLPAKLRRSLARNERYLAKSHVSLPLTYSLLYPLLHPPTIVTLTKTYKNTKKKILYSRSLISVKETSDLTLKWMILTSYVLTVMVLCKLSEKISTAVYSDTVSIQ